MSPRISFTKDDVTLHLTSLLGEPVSSTLTHDEAAKLAADIAHALTFPWRNHRHDVQFCPRHPEWLIAAGATCTECHNEAKGVFQGEPCFWNQKVGGVVPVE